DLVGDEEDAVLVADSAQTLQEAILGDDVAALALDRLDDHRRDLARRYEALEENLVEPAQILDLPVWGMEDPGQQRPEASVVLRLRRRERHRPIGPAMESAQEGHDVGPTSGVTG